MRQVAESAFPEGKIGMAELYDLRSLYPLDWRTLLESVQRTRRLLVIEPDVAYAGIGAEILARVAETVPGAGVYRLGAPRENISANREERAALLPNTTRIALAVRAIQEGRL